MQIRVKEDPKEFGNCGCGRSPTGKCIGWHGLSEDEWSAQKTQLIHNLNSNHSPITYYKDMEEGTDGDEI
jgi:hypothetical protein